MTGGGPLPGAGAGAGAGEGAAQLRIEVVPGDLTTQDVDAVVNAASPSLLGGGGVDGALHAAAGPSLLAQCRELRRTRYPAGLPVGEAVATAAGTLPARWVIHTVGPNRHRGQTDPDLLASCFQRSLDVAQGLPARSVAFPAVSAGVYGWDVRDVARIALVAVRSWTPDGDQPAAVQLVRFVLHNAAALEAFEVAARLS